MTLMEYTQAYIAVTALMEREMDYAAAYGLVRLKRALAPQAEFFAAEENKLVDKYAKKDKKGQIVWTAPGRFAFAEPERAGEYAAERAKLGQVEAGEEFKRMKLKAPERLTPAQLEALEPFVEFEGADA